MASPSDTMFGSEPPRKVKGDGFRDRYQLVAKSRAPLGPGIVVSILAHVAMFGGALVYARYAAPRVVAERPIIAKLVRLGKPRDEKLLPRLPNAPPPPTAAPPVAVSVPSAAPPAPSATAKSIDAKPEPPRERANEAMERQRKLMEALDKLGAPTTGPTSKVHEDLPGQADGDRLGDAEKAAEGDRYLALVDRALHQNFVVPTTISEKERLFLSCVVFIKITPDGRVSQSRLTTPSGNDQFDRAVERGLQTTTLPPPPAAFLARYGEGLELHFKP